MLPAKDAKGRERGSGGAGVACCRGQCGSACIGGSNRSDGSVFGETSWQRAHRCQARLRRSLGVHPSTPDSAHPPGRGSLLLTGRGAQPESRSLFTSGRRIWSPASSSRGRPIGRQASFASRLPPTGGSDASAWAPCVRAMVCVVGNVPPAAIPHRSVGCQDRLRRSLG